MTSCLDFREEPESETSLPPPRKPKRNEPAETNPDSRSSHREEEDKNTKASEKRGKETEVDPARKQEQSRKQKRSDLVQLLLQRAATVSFKMITIAQTARSEKQETALKTRRAATTSGH